MITSSGKFIAGRFKLYNRKAEVVAEFELTTQDQYDNWVNNKDELLFPGKEKSDIVAFVPEKVV